MQHLPWERVKREALNDKLSRRVVHGEKITLARLELAQGCTVPAHQHENEQITMVHAGVLKFSLGGQEVVARAGEVLVIPPNVPHNVTALEDSVAFDVFSPIRSDWIQGKDSYLRKCAGTTPVRPRS
jgi:quercetin dioxygenase-like cupin family protein